MIPGMILESRRAHERAMIRLAHRLAAIVALIIGMAFIPAIFTLGILIAG